MPDKHRKYRIFWDLLPQMRQYRHIFSERADSFHRGQLAFPERKIWKARPHLLVVLRMVDLDFQINVGNVKDLLHWWAFVILQEKESSRCIRKNHYRKQVHQQDYGGLSEMRKDMEGEIAQ